MPEGYEWYELRPALPCPLLICRDVPWMSYPARQLATMDTVPRYFITAPCGLGSGLRDGMRSTCKVIYPPGPAPMRVEPSAVPLPKL